MSDLFDLLEDESPTSPGQEIGEAVADAVRAVGQAHAEQSSLLAQVLADAVRSISPPPAVVNQQEIRQWVFYMERDDKGLLTSVNAVAVEP